jgi:alkaline phosphatase D
MADRREFLRCATLLGATAVAVRPFPRLRYTTRLVEDPFTLGVASGDPHPGGMVLWTRLAPTPLQPDGGMDPEPVGVDWEIAHDELFSRVARRGRFDATPEAAHSVHVEVEGLDPDRVYWYRFVVDGIASPVGRSRTAPRADAALDRFPFAYASCQHYEQGFFTAHRHLAEEDVRLIVHLGDYIYENGGSPDRARRHGPTEIVSLADYRVRHALYKLDADLQASHASAPWIVTWDDHEVDNNYADDLDDRGSLEEGFLKRRAAAYRAHWEHMPLGRASMPQGPAGHIYRRLRLGNLIELNVLDGRQYRTDQPCDDGIKPLCAEATDPAATMLGFEQERWLMQGLAQSRARWNVLGNQTPFAPIDNVPGDGATYSMDRWDGYPAARQRLLDFLRERKPANPVVISGDIHSNWAAELRADFGDPGSPLVGVELIGTSISSAGDGQDVSDFGRRALEANPHLRFHNSQRGYVRCVVTPDRWQADYRVLPYVTRPGAPVSTRSSFVVENGRPGLVSS